MKIDIDKMMDESIQELKDLIFDTTFTSCGKEPSYNDKLVLSLSNNEICYNKQSLQDMQNQFILENGL